MEFAYDLVTSLEIKCGSWIVEVIALESNVKVEQHVKLLLLTVSKVTPNVILRNLTLCIGKTLEISEDGDEISHRVSFHHGLHC